MRAQLPRSASAQAYRARPLASPRLAEGEFTGAVPHGVDCGLDADEVKTH